MDLAHTVRSTEELKELLRDMPWGGELPMRRGVNHAPVSQRECSVTSAAEVRDNSFVVAVMGGTSCQAPWRPARKNYAVAVMGGADLDFREAVLGPKSSFRLASTWSAAAPALWADSRASVSQPARLTMTLQPFA